MKKEYAEEYVSLEKEHWWFRGRRVILRQLLRNEIDWSEPRTVLEIGVGPGENLYTLYPENAELMGVEPDADNARRADERGPVQVHQGTVENLPDVLKDRSFDIIAMFDVLEHIEDDRGALEILRMRLKPGGRLVLSVPAYQWMWGEHDEVNLHFRRYTRGGLKRLLEDAGLAVRRATYFNTLLFPPIALVRLLARLMRNRKERGGAAESDFKKPAGVISGILFRLFASEAIWLRLISFPFGVSVFVSAERKEGVDD